MRHLALPLVTAWATALFACSGNPEGGAPVEGTVEIEADCEAPTEASFRLTR